MVRIRKEAAGRGAGGPSAAAPGRGGMNERLLLDRNNAMIEEIQQSVDQLRDISVEIGDVAKRQNRMLDGMDDDMQGTGQRLGAAVSRVYALVSTGGGRSMCYLVLFSFAVFCFVYLVM